MQKITKKQFKEFLNKEFPEPTWKHGRYHQRTRPYGDYLYSQDKIKFDVLFEEWKKEQKK